MLPEGAPELTHPTRIKPVRDKNKHHAHVKKLMQAYRPGMKDGTRT
jgi:hypothetical protein